MGWVALDVARTADDFARVDELIRRMEPGITVAPIGQPGNTTYVGRDEDDRDRIVGLIHVEQAVEIRHFLILPEYEYKKATATLLRGAMEGNLRVAGIGQYYFTVPKDNERVIDIYKRDGAQPIDTAALRFLKRL